MRQRTTFIYSTRTDRGKIENIEVDDIVWALAIAGSCIDADRCNGRHEPYGSCNECLGDALRIINKLE